jgi:hypothetical protein
MKRQTEEFNFLTCIEDMTSVAKLESFPATLVTPSLTPSLMS